jgi:membrane-associated phospholipid phosphatase
MLKRTDHRYLLGLLFFYSGFCFSQQSGQNAAEADSLPGKKTFFQSKTYQIGLAPAVLFAGSALTWGERKGVRELRNRYIPTFRHHYDDYLQYVPALSVYALNAAGIRGKNSIKRATVSYAFSVVIMAAIVNSIKYTAKVERPDGSTRNSFPSGHTANSFMNATFLQKEYGTYRHPLYGVAGYTMATATAFGRQLNNRHWISDVLAGAGIGILSTQLGYLIADGVFKDRGQRAPFRKGNLFPTTDRPSFLEMKFGAASILDGDLTDKHHGLYAKTGFNMGLEGAWFFHKNIGIGGEFAFSSFPMNSDGLDLGDPDADSVSSGLYTQPMGVRYLHIGPFFSFPLQKNWFITAKITAGRSVGAKGDVMLQIKEELQEDFGLNELPVVQYKPEGAFSWSVGAGLQKRISRNLGIKAYLNYFNSKHDFDVADLADIDENGSYVFSDAGSTRVSFDQLVYGFSLTAYLW